MVSKQFRIFLFGWSVLLFGALSVYYRENTPPSPPEPRAQATPVPTSRPRQATAAYDPKLVKMGGKLFAQAQAEYSPEAAYIDVWGSGYPDAAAALFIPREMWDSLGRDEREALTAFIRSEIPGIRKDPDRYIAFARGVNLYERLYRNITNMADGRYVIMTTIRRNGQWIKETTVEEGS